MEQSSNAPTRPPSRASIRSSQESGVTGASGNSFIGPMQEKDHYHNAHQWAVVPFTSSAEIFLDPDPDERRRDVSAWEPVVMRPLPGGNALASIITILGHIPLVRTTLANGSTVTDYGSNPEWWKGTKIELATVVHAEEPHHKSAYELMEETQRLMAFVNSSTRSYGSVLSLSQLDAVKAAISSNIRTNPDAQDFLVAWSNISMQLNHYTNLFRTTALHFEPGKEDEKVPFYIIDIGLGKNLASQARTLYDGADETLWGEDPDGTSDENYCLDTVPAVLSIRVKNHDESTPGLDMYIPHTWYVDRYLQENMEAAKDMRHKRSRYQRELESIEKRREKLLRVTLPSAEKSDERHNKQTRETPKKERAVNAKILIESTIKYLIRPDPVEKSATNDKESAREMERAEGKENEKRSNSDEEVMEVDETIASAESEVITAQVDPTATAKSHTPKQRRPIELAKQLESILEQIEKRLQGNCMSQHLDSFGSLFRRSRDSA